MNKYFKRTVSICLVLVMVVAMGIVTNAAENDLYSARFITSEDEISLLSDLYDKDNVYTNSGSFTVDKISAVSGEGKNIRVWFPNEGTQDVTVSLIRYKWLGLSEENVLNFTVAAGKNVYKEYHSDNADKGDYKVILTTSSGSKIKGYLRVRQYAN